MIISCIVVIVVILFSALVDYTFQLLFVYRPSSTVVIPESQ